MSSVTHGLRSAGQPSHSSHVAKINKDDDLPELKAHFFYTSPLSIDDPLSAVPSPAAFDNKTTRHPPRPFSPYDNIALEKAWLSLYNGTYENDGRSEPAKGADPSDPSGSLSSSLPTNEHNVISVIEGAGDIAAGTRSSRIPSQKAEARQEPDNSAGSSWERPASGSERVQELETGQGNVPGDNSTSVFSESMGSSEQGIVESLQKELSHTKNSETFSGLQANETGTTGLPFVRAPSRHNAPPSVSPGSYTFHEEEQRHEHPHVKNQEDESGSHISSEGQTVAADVPVGVSRLHHVELPALVMKPIYWSPVHDVAAVTRGTWFYKDTLFPVEPAVANQLELGYRELRPWSRTWKDELNSAIQVGAAGEEKVAHRLWPKDGEEAAMSTPSSDPSCAAKLLSGKIAAEGSIEPENSEGDIPDSTPKRKRYAECQVIYRDSKNAFILKPSLQPSAYYGRKPLQKIKKGISVGIHVVRGLEWAAWEKLHPPKRTPKAAQLNIGIDTAIEDPIGQQFRDQARPKVTDLIFVIHGIGQKLSERVESFHFTHAINSFRRSVNLELSDEKIRRVLRGDLGGVMILPINWRSNLSFEDGGPMKKGDKGHASSDFTLKDITVDTIPAVRNIISDVMLDIPFYMSHHKPKMIQAVISEANRVYRLWCKNNPGFHEEGRVHIIAHSLGSAMALEVLSKQPTHVPELDLEDKEINRDYFDFSTTNLFFAGSPAGFFLLLDRGRLIPRRGRKKPGAEPGDDTDKNIVGEQGTLGCLAVDNIYNIMHSNDPIAYRLNATVDSVYAATLKKAFVPNAKAGFFESIGNAVKSLTPGAGSVVDVTVGQAAAPASVARLPSQVELEVHDFTLEEIAEKKFYLLNDNGQVDWFMSSGGGPLDIQYINMLGAHSSYWITQDFVRMVVTEVGRKPGRNNTFLSMQKVRAKS